MPPSLARRRAGVLLGLVGLLAATEWVCAARAYRSRLGPADWETAAAALAAIPGDEPVLLADDWLDPSARQHLPGVRPFVGLADLHGVPRFHVLALGDPLTATVQDDLAGLVPEPHGVDPLGPLALHHYDLPTSGHVLWDILLNQPAMRAADDLGPCRSLANNANPAPSWTCKRGRVGARYAEIGYRPRRCLALDLTDGATFELRGTVDLGARLRGHLGFTDFNGRLRNDAPVILEITVDGITRARWSVTDNQGWAAFELPTTAGPAELVVRVTSLLAGTFTPPGYDPEARRTPCLDLRAIDP